MSQIFANEKDLITIGGGVHNLFRDKHRTTEFLIEYKPKCNYKKFHPFFGAMITARSAFYIYGGISFDFVAKGFFISPNIAAGYYNKGKKGRNLGCPLEFRSSLFLGYEFLNYSRIGTGIYHISNASISNHNPGSESLILFYSFPINLVSNRK